MINRVSITEFRGKLVYLLSKYEVIKAWQNSDEVLRNVENQLKLKLDAQTSADKAPIRTKKRI